MPLSLILLLVIPGIALGVLMWWALSNDNRDLRESQKYATIDYDEQWLDSIGITLKEGA